MGTKFINYEHAIEFIRKQMQTDYVPRHGRGRGLMQLEMSFKTITIGLNRYLSTTNDWMLQLVLFDDAGNNARSVSEQINKFTARN